MDLTKRKKEVRMKKIRSLAYFISESYPDDFQTNLTEILKDESLMIFYDHYDEYFDGLLFFDNNSFFIHLNIDKGNFPDSKRSRFSIAHELGHYFISEHHENIVNGNLRYHPSKFEINRKNLIEEEADYFAACLLMPSKKFKTACYKKPFSLELIEKLSNDFNVSRLSTLLRFADQDAGTFPIMISFFRNGLLSGYKQSNDFPYKNVPFKSKIGQPPPPTSVLGEYYLKSDAKYTSVQQLYADDWFWINSSKPIFEQCFYSNYGYDISIIWPE